MRLLGLVGVGGIDPDGSDEFVVDQHGHVGVVEVDAGGAAGVADTDDPATPACADDAVSRDRRGDVLGGAGKAIPR